MFLVHHLFGSGVDQMMQLAYLGTFDHDLTATEAWEMMVYLREIITLYSPTIQVSELYCSHLLYIHIHIVHIPYIYP